MINQIQALPLFQGKNVEVKNEPLIIKALISPDSNPTGQGQSLIILKAFDTDTQETFNDAVYACINSIGCYIQVSFKLEKCEETENSIKVKIVPLDGDMDNIIDLFFEHNELTEEVFNNIPDIRGITYEYFTTLMSMVDIVRNS